MRRSQFVAMRTPYQGWRRDAQMRLAMAYFRGGFFLLWNSQKYSSFRSGYFLGARTGTLTCLEIQIYPAGRAQPTTVLFAQWQPRQGKQDVIPNQIA